MALDKRTREQMLALCGEIHADDGIDPRTYFQPNRSHKKENYKAKQLCRQVAETLDQVLAGETGDDVLRNLHVVAAAPAPDSSRLLVTLHADVSPAKFDREAIEQRLASHRGRLRCAVASAITRRKTPILTFRVLGPETELARVRKEGGP